MIININNRYFNYFSNVIISFIIAIYFRSQPILGFLDREVYLYNHMGEAIYRLYYWLNEPIIGKILGEPVWLMINYLFGIVFGFEEGLLNLIFFSSFLGIFSVMSLIDKYNIDFKNKFIYLIIFFGVGFMYSKYTMHLRQGFAISVFLFAYCLNGTKKNLLILLTPLIHVSFFLVIPFYYLVEFLKGNTFKKHNLSVLFLSLLFGVVVFVYLPVIGDYFDIYKVDQYESLRYETSGFGFIFWLTILCLFLYSGRDFIYSNLFSIIGIMIFLISYNLFGNPGRLFNNFQPLVILSGLSLKGYNYYIFLIAMLLIIIISL